jgi:hypothetical protein
VKVLIAADADWVVDEVVAALAGSDVSFTVCTDSTSRRVRSRTCR